MSFEIIVTPTFRRSFKQLSKRHVSLKRDFQAFSESLMQDPCQGVELCPGVRKIRMAISSKGRGKSGGARIITYTIDVSEIDGIIYLLDIYDKSDYSTIDIEVLKEEIKKLDISDL